MAASSPSPSSSPSSSAGATGSSVHDSSKEKTNFTRLARLLIDGGTEALRKFLDSIYPPKALDNVLKKNRTKFENLKSKRVIFDHQWEKLFPSSGDLPDSKTFDITLLHLLIREVCYLPAPLTGWHKMPAEDDDSLEASITRIKCFRNELCHSVSTCIPNDEFEDKWNKIASSLETIEIGACRQKIQGLKNDPINDDTCQLVEEQVEQWRTFQQQEERGPISQLDSHLPDMSPMFGRLKELKQIIEDVESRAVSVVLITGGPGFGKTTVAKTVAHDLANRDNERTVLFCRLLSKKTFNEVATAMIHSCGKIHTQLPENPAQWLKDWSKQIQMHVTFVLDNADGVLETEDRYSFLSLLSTMGELSKQKVTFVITSRKTFKHPDLRSKDVRLEPLSPEEAKKILISRVNEEKIRKKLSKTEKIVDLCGCVPLALCIVGSLLSDYTEEKLIKHLEQEPMAVLEDDDISFRTAIKTSFDLLTKAEQDALILMSMFRGSFNCDAAEVVIKAGSDASGTLPVSILRSLKNRSLVEQASSHRYQLHPLIRAFAKKIGQTDENDPQVLDVGKQLACAHFMSRLDDNANMFWSKDTCKESIESFNEDRPNFEQFLQVYCQGMGNHDQEIADSCKGFLEDLPQKCMYLEKCVQPKFYIEILEGLLKSFDRKIQPVHVVELLCLLGHEMRKEGDNTKYNDYMEEAIQLYKKNVTEFETMALSEVIYLHSYARFLSEENVVNDPRPKNMYDTALKICKTKIPDHPETAATLLFAGRNAKRRKKNNEAVEKFKQALDLFRKRLGDHFMTALCLKDIADFLLFVKTDDHLTLSLSHYKEALKVMENIGMDGQKESILMLKNYGVCHQRNGNFEEAISLLQRAERLAKREIEGDHKWKVMVKTVQATLYHEEAIKKEIKSSTRKSLEDQMEASMKEGLLMCYKVGDQTIEQLGNKQSIRKILDYYPKRFPEKEYPRK